MTNDDRKEQLDLRIQLSPSGIAPSISAVIPAYNAERTIARAITSALEQTYHLKEIIVVDDGSSDKTSVIARECGAIVRRRPNGGLSAARNTGIRAASGEWIALLDADDFWAPNKLRRQVDTIKPGTILVYSGIQYFDDRGNGASQYAVDASSAKSILRYRNPITPSTVLAKREMLMQDGGFREDVSACEDWDMWFRLKDLGDFEAVAEPLTKYYVHPASLSANPERMLHALNKILSSTLLSDLRGLDRWIWRRRILATQLCSAGLIARENGLDGEVQYMYRSLCAWPSPLWESRRFATFLISIRNKMNLRRDRL